MTDKYTRQVDFFSEISDRQMSAREFFNETLLESIERNFGFDRVLIGYFNTEGELLSCKISDKISIKHTQKAFERFAKYDVVCETIYKEAKRDALTYFNVKPRVYRATDIITNQYQQSAYARFMGRYYDSHYTATMAFGINAYIKLIFFKGEDEGNFSDKELEELNKLYIYVANAYRNFKKHEQMKIVSHIQSQIIELNEKAYVITDCFMGTMNYNQKAEEYLKEIFGAQITQQLNSDTPCHWMTLLLGLEQEVESDIKTRTLKDYVFKIRTYNQTYSNGIVDSYYWITISKHKEEKVTQIKYCVEQLTQTEQKVAEFMYAGLTYKQIAEELFVSYHTIKKHVENIYSKCGVKSRFQLNKWLENRK